MTSATMTATATALAVGHPAEAPATPLVSCIMPTRDRRQFVGQAIWYFLRQDYPARELIILDDGDDSVADLVPADERIHYARLDRRMTVGAKRNLACELSRGELIAHWDDDDWIGPDRLTRQVRALQSSGADVCGAHDLRYYRPEGGDAWMYRHQDTGWPWLAGCTLLYRRRAWTEHPFADVNVGEDGLFVRACTPGQVQPLNLDSCYVALIHPDNAGSKNLADLRWERQSLDDVARLLAFDRSFYVALRNGTAGQQPWPVRQASTAITVAAWLDVYSGYGSMAEYLILGLARAGADVRVLPLHLDPAGFSQEFLQIVGRPRPEPGGPALYFSLPQPDIERLGPVDSLFINTMWESSRLPSAWPAVLNRARTVIVPTRFVAQACRESGVTVPIEVIPEGVDPAIYQYQDRPERPGITTLTVGPLDDRKHVRVGIAAWKRAFADDPDARLIIKTSYNYQNYVPDDPRIRYVDAREQTRGIAHWYRQADVLLALGNEGFGLPLVEGMASGLPVVALNSEGQADACDDAGDLLLSVKPGRWEPYVNNLYGPCGTRGVPAVEDVEAQLRWVATHRGEARALGRAASTWALTHRNVWAKGPAVLDVMEQRSRPQRPLRRRRTFWTPSWGDTCGLAEYTAHLVKPLTVALAPSYTAVQVTRTPLDPAGLRLLHVQHEHSLFDDVELTRQIQGARQAGVPVVVTEHTVGPSSQPWEREADALVALTQRGAHQLRARWPHKRVEHLPLGCPTWFPPGKMGHGRVIGAFGFLEPYKGFWRVLESLRELPDAELLMFSHARRPEIAAQWDKDATGLPVRRVGDFLPVEEVACRLAAEADLLVFWYEGIDHVSASYAVRIGLATGVPVLVSSTTWFEDLGEAVYRPATLTEGIERLLTDEPLRRSVTDAAREYCHANSWQRSAEAHIALWESLEGR
jgi:glycosyltransferase involved in cell wall biosynthesis